MEVQLYQIINIKKMEIKNKMVGALAYFDHAVDMANTAESFLNKEGIEISYYHILKLMIECQKVEILNRAFNCDCEDENDPLSRIANSLSVCGNENDNGTTVVRELFDLNHNIVIK